MSAYSRRGDRDDRRPSDSHSRPREYGRSVSDSYRDERDRDRDRNRDRDRDRDHDRGRGKDVESPRDRDRFSFGYTNRDPRPNPVDNSRSEHVAKASPLAPMAASPLNVDGYNIAEYVGKLLASYLKDAEAHYVQLSALAHSKAQLEKAMTNRAIEHERTKAKHAEFPSIPQLQNKYKVRDDKQRKIIEDKEGEVKKNLASLRDSLVKSLGKSLSHANFDNRPEAVLPQPADKDFDSKITNLENALKEQQANLVTTRDALQKQQDELLQKTKDFTKDFPLALKEVAEELETKPSKLALEQQHDAFQLQLQQLREEMEASFESRLLKQKEESKKELEAALAKHEEKSRQELLAALATLEAKSEKVSQEAMSTLQRETRHVLERTNSALNLKAKALADEIDSVRKEQASLRSELPLVELPLMERVNQSLEQLGHQIADARASVNAHAQQLEKCEEKMLEHDMQLGSIDMSLWGEIADFSITFPALQTRVDNMKTDLERLKTQHTPAPASTQRGSTASPGPAGRPVSGTPGPAEKYIMDVMDQRFEKVAAILGKMVEELKGKVKYVQQLAESNKQRIENLEQQRASDCTNIDEVKTRVTKLEEQTIPNCDHVGKLTELGEQVAALEEQAASDRARLDTLSSVANPTAKSPPPRSSATGVQTSESPEEALNTIQAEWTKTQLEFMSLRKMIAQKTDYFDSLKHQMSVLNSRYENLRTEDLAKAILGRLEQLYPDPGAIRSGFEESKKRFADIEVTLQTLKQEGDHNGRDIEAILSTFTTIKDGNRPAKRQRMDHDFDGDINGISNGLANSGPNGLSRIANGNHD